MFSERLKALRKASGLTQIEFSKLFSISAGTIAMWETGKRHPDSETLIRIAQHFNVTTDYLLGFDSNLRPLNAPLSVGGKIPVLGKIPAGVPIEAIQEIVDEIEISGRFANDAHEYFALLVTGDSMFPEYQDGDIVIVRKQETADTGDDVVAYINGYDATLKRLVKSPMGLTLRALNPAYESKTFSLADVENLPVCIAGIVVEQRRNRRK